MPAHLHIFGRRRSSRLLKGVAEFTHSDPLKWGTGVTMSGDDGICGSLFSRHSPDSRLVSAIVRRFGRETTVSNSIDAAAAKSAGWSAGALGDPSIRYATHAPTTPRRRTSPLPCPCPTTPGPTGANSTSGARLRSHGRRPNRLSRSRARRRHGVACGSHLVPYKNEAGPRDSLRVAESAPPTPHTRALLLMSASRPTACIAATARRSTWRR